MSTWVIAGMTFREAARRRVLATAMLFGVAFLILYGVGLNLLLSRPPFAGGFSPVLRRQGLNFFLVMGLYAVNFMVVMLTVLTSVDTLAGEIASGTIQAVVTKPIRRWEVVIGKWIGFAGMLTAYVVFMAGGVIIEMYLFAGYAPAHVLRGAALICLESLLLLSVTFLGGTSFTTLATGVLAFGLHGLAFLGGWIEEFGSIARSQTAVNIGVVASVLMPSEALWRRAAFEIQSPMVAFIGRGPFTSTSVPSLAMVLYAGVYLAVMLGLALRRFERRDL